MFKAERRFTVKIHDEEIPVRSVCRDYPVRTPEGVEAGSVFAYEYTREGCREDRPVLFAFNGGPGSSSLWLHMGILGPKHVNCDNVETLSGSGDFEIEDNPYSPIDVCDLVILDPVGTGYGLALDRDAAKCAYGFVNDARVLADVIETWIVENNRFGSKKYILGESYGSVRSVAVANYLMGGCVYEGCVSKGISVDGIINLGNIILRESEKGDYTGQERYLEESVHLLPAFAATAWYHGGSRKTSLADTVRWAYDFCADKYVKALYLGNRLPDEERSQIADELSALTGVEKELLIHNDLRISGDWYLRWFKEKHGMTISPYDTRFTGRYAPGLKASDLVGDDEMMSRCMPGFLGAFQEIGREFLGLDFSRKFSVINFNVNETWSYESEYTPFEHLQFLLNRSRKFRILIGNGAFDLVTSIGQVRYTVSHLKYDDGQVVIREYPAGHMPYLGAKGGEDLARDIRAFVRGASMQSDDTSDVLNHIK